MDLFFFGTFNPISIAHINLAKYALEKINANKVIFVPTNDKYILENKNSNILSNDLRIKLLNIVRENNPWMEISLIEINKDKISRTYYSLLELKRLGYNGKLLLGSDNLISLTTKKWKYVDKILKEFGIVCINRNNDNINDIIKNDKLLNKFSNNIIVIDDNNSYLEISSTKIREAIIEKKLENIKSFLSNEVYNYLVENNI